MRIRVWTPATSLSFYTLDIKLASAVFSIYYMSQLTDLVILKAETRSKLVDSFSSLHFDLADKVSTMAAHASDVNGCGHLSLSLIQ